jgi:site-specific recombinase XerD
MGVEYAFMRFWEYREPALLEQSRCILAIPFKRTDVALIDHLFIAEMEAILNAPNLKVRDGLRDRAMLHLCFSAGLRVSELVSLPLAALDLQSTPTRRRP